MPTEERAVTRSTARRLLLVNAIVAASVFVATAVFELPSWVLAVATASVGATAVVEWFVFARVRVQERPQKLPYDGRQAAALRDYRGLWVALGAPDEVLASAESPD